MRAQRSTDSTMTTFASKLLFAVSVLGVGEAAIASTVVLIVVDACKYIGASSRSFLE